MMPINEPQTWTPGAPAGQRPEDLPMNEWVGQALGHASMCWVGGTGDKEFDSVEASRVLDGLMAHINGVIDGVIQETTKAVACRNEPHLGLATTRELLEELAARLCSGGLERYEATVRDIKGGLSSHMLDYRTVDS